jgi:hypothetical protein
MSLIMKAGHFLLAVLLTINACSRLNEAARQHALRCWDNISVAGADMRLSAADAIYLRGKALIIPSSRCHGERLQVIDYSPEAISALNKIEYRNTSRPLGFRATLIVQPIRRATPKVIEVRAASIADAKLLNERYSMRVLNLAYGSK